MRPFARLALRSLAVLSIALAGLVVALLAVNAFDEELSPEVVELLKPLPPSTARDDDNGYYVYIGLDAPPGADARAFGRAQVEKLVKEDERLQRITQAERAKEAGDRWQAAVRRLEAGQFTPEDREPGRMKIAPGASKYLCVWPCLERVKANGPQMKRALDEHREVLDRYRLLLRYSRFTPTYVPLEYETQNRYVEQTGTFSSFHRAWTTQVVLEFDAGDLDRAFADLKQDVALLRRLLQDAPSFGHKVSAERMLRTELALLADLIVANPAAARQSHARIEAMLALFTPDELSWKGMAKAEMTPGVRALVGATPQDATDWLLWPFFKRNATVNRIYAAERQLYEWNEFPPGNEAALRLRIANADQPLRFPYWAVPYNPIGKLYLTNTNFKPYTDHYMEYYDLEGLRRLVALSARASQSREDIPGVIKDGGPALSDPHTGKPMQWDADRKQVYFEPRSEWWLRQNNPGGVKGRVAIKVGGA